MIQSRDIYILPFLHSKHAKKQSRTSLLRNIFLLRNTFLWNVSRKKTENNRYLTNSIQIQSDGRTLLNHSHSCPDSILKRSALEGFHKCRAQSTSAAYTVASMTLI